MLCHGAILPVLLKSNFYNYINYHIYDVGAYLSYNACRNLRTIYKSSALFPHMGLGDRIRVTQLLLPLSASSLAMGEGGVLVCSPGWP